jgi:type II restriction enzyme
MIGYGANGRRMNLRFDIGRTELYTSGTQRARILTEGWVASQVYCPNCGHSSLARYANNNPVGDFHCVRCGEDYELKSQRSRFGAKVVDGAYKAMMQRLGGATNPNLLLLNYAADKLCVTDLVIVPKHFFTPDLIEERAALPSTARRAGWIGCRILLDQIPDAGRITVIRNGAVEPKGEVISRWRQTLFLRGQASLAEKSWLIHVMKCIERIGKRQFALNEVYAFEDELKLAYPGNQHIRAKIRQRLQVLRDNGFIEFLGRGTYRIVGTRG